MESDCRHALVEVSTAGAELTGWGTHTGHDVGSEILNVEPHRKNVLHSQDAFHARLVRNRQAATRV